MIRNILLTFVISIVSCISAFAQDARWIAPYDRECHNPGSWAAFRKDVKIDKVPDSAIAKIGVDSKYWLWINGELAVFEGGLKRGPNPNDTYYDELDIAPFLKKGVNKIAVLVWHFGLDGFSHKDSGKMGLFFEVKQPDLHIYTDQSWISVVHPAYSRAMNPPPNYRLSESNIKFDQNKDIPNWQTANNINKTYNFRPSTPLAFWGEAPWNKMHKRPIPQWKLWDVRVAPMKRESGENGMDKIVATLPYNMQMTPIITVTDEQGGSLISIMTDHTYAASETNLRAEYITKKGTYTYESYGWLNGQQIILELPKHVKVESITYRESGYNTEIAGTFSCDSDYYTRFWNKALRTLYINMRDNFFDCPERERAQWWGDAVLLMSEAFYTLTPSSHALMRKAIMELVAWQKPDGTIRSPIPGMYDGELPAQMLASVGRYGFWNYYMNTGDAETMKFAYPHIKRYLATWKLDEAGLPIFNTPDRSGWFWGDWGRNKDMRLIYAAWYYMALETAANIADLMNIPSDAKEYRNQMQIVKDAFNKTWNGYVYRHPTYKQMTDDRVQALAVISGIADKSKYPAIYRTLQKEFHSSPYMEKYVLEALFIMEKGEYGLARTQLRFEKMVNDPFYDCLFEGWEKGGYGGGSTNHAWSGGALTVISQYLCGIYPLEPAWKTFKIEPYPASFDKASISIPTIAGEVKSAFVRNGDKFTMEITVPKGTTAMLYLPEWTKGKTISLNDCKDISKYAPSKFKHSLKQTLQLPEGEYKLEVK